MKWLPHAAKDSDSVPHGDRAKTSVKLAIRQARIQAINPPGRNSHRGWAVMFNATEPRELLVE